MPQIKLKGGFYQARSIIANAQRCVNLYPEKNPEDSPFPYTMYLTPGLTQLRAGGAADGPVAGVGRGTYEASNGQCFAVVQHTLYHVDEQFRFTSLLTLSDTSRTTPISMYDNGTYLVLVDGSTTGYYVELANLANVGTLTSADNYLGSDFVDYLDTYLLFNQPNTKEFYCTLSDSIAIDPLDVGSKVGQPDNIQCFQVIHREIWIWGAQRSTEVWYNPGNTAGFPFNATPGVFIEQGCIAKYSKAKNDLMTFWLGRNKDGERTVFMGKGYEAKRISTPAIAYLLSQISDVSDAIGMTYTQQDHVFYVLTFPTGNKTIVYDVSENEWHERTYTDSNGNENRVRYNNTAIFYNTIVAQDHSNGNLYKLDTEKYVDEVNGTNTTAGQPDSVSPITRRRGFPHTIFDMNKASFPAFQADLQAGESQLQLENVPIYLRFSDDRGRTWSNPIETSMGQQGEYLTLPQWNQLGLARDKVFELFWTAPVNTALNGAWIIEPRVAKT